MNASDMNDLLRQYHLVILRVTTCADSGLGLILASKRQEATALYLERTRGGVFQASRVYAS